MSRFPTSKNTIMDKPDLDDYVLKYLMSFLSSQLDTFIAFCNYDPVTKELQIHSISETAVAIHFGAMVATIGMIVSFPPEAEPPVLQTMTLMNKVARLLGEPEPFKEQHIVEPKTTHAMGYDALKNKYPAQAAAHMKSIYGFADPPACHHCNGSHIVNRGFCPHCTVN